MTAAGNEPAPSPRLASIDVLRAVGIAAVVFVHAVGGPRNDAELYGLHVSRSAVPLFFALSGWAEGRAAPGEAGRTRRRLGRVLPPYLVAATLAELYTAWRGPHRSAGQIVRDYLLGDSFGQYYFVFLLTAMILLSPLFARLSRRALLWTWLAIVGSRLVGLTVMLTHPQWATTDLFWVNHDPFHAAQYFLAGWLAHSYHDRIGAAVRAHRSAVFGATILVATALVSMTVLVENSLVANIAGYLNPFAVGAAAALAATYVGRVSAATRFVSRASYTFYLFHLFFVFEVQRVLPSSSAWWVLAWFAGMLGPCLVVFTAHRLLGERARTWFG